MRAVDTITMLHHRTEKEALLLRECHFATSRGGLLHHYTVLDFMFDSNLCIFVLPVNIDTNTGPLMLTPRETCRLVTACEGPGPMHTETGIMPHWHNLRWHNVLFMKSDSRHRCGQKRSAHNQYCQKPISGLSMITTTNLKL